jgi:hypothetical protein
VRVPHAPTVAMNEAHPSLLGHHSSDETVEMDLLPVATENYRPSVHKRIIVVS